MGSLEGLNKHLQDLPAVKYLEALQSAFPDAEDVIRIEHAETTMVSSFLVCRSCGALVLESMKLIHLQKIHIKSETVNMEPQVLDSGKRVEIIMSAFPNDEDEITFEHAGTTMRSTFQVCRLCGDLVLASMTPTHINEIHVRNANFN